MVGHQGQQGQAHYRLGTMQGKLRTRIRNIRLKTYSHQDPDYAGEIILQHAVNDPFRHQDPNYNLGNPKTTVRAKIRTMLGKLRSQIHAMTRAILN
jgi:hypothetical protein